MFPWESLFALGIRDRSTETSDLVPFWIYPGDAKIERHVPNIPLSHDREHLENLRHSLTIYRLAFGQSRQEDLLTYLHKHLPESDIEQISKNIQINLEPSTIHAEFST
jgi:hypothetical protein